MGVVAGVPDLALMLSDDHGRWHAGPEAEMALGLRARLGRGSFRHGAQVSAGLDFGAEDAGGIGAGVMTVLEW